jgi:hypothetical protein
MRYVSWFGYWLGHLIPAAGRPHRRESRNGSKVPVQTALLSSEELFYIAMLGPHV